MIVIWRNEMANVMKDSGLIIFFIAAPVFYPLLYSALYNNEEVTDVPVVVVDNCNTTQSRQFRRMVDATKDVKVVGMAASKEEAMQALQQRKACAVMEIPRSFTRDIEHHTQTCVHLFTDMTSLLYYKACLLSVTNVSLAMNAQIQTQLASDKTQREQEINAAPLNYVHVALFNTQNGYGSFLIPGVLILIIQQLMIIGVGMAAGTARNNNPGGILVPRHGCYAGTFRIVFGKAFCYQLIWFIEAFYLLALVPRIFGLPHFADGISLLSLLVPYVISCCFFSMFLSVLIKEREDAFVAYVCFSVVLLFISGISWPWTVIPAPWRMVAHLFPSTFGIQGFMSLNTMSATLADAHYSVMALWVQAFIYFLLTFIFYRIEIHKTFRQTLPA